MCDLTDLKDFNLKDFAINIVKYQNFRSVIALNKFAHNYKERTARNYFDWGCKYLNDNKRIYTCNKLYDYIDEAVAKHVTPLTPSETDKRTIYKTKSNRAKLLQKKDAVINIHVPEKITQRYESGLRNGNLVLILKDEDEVNMLLDTLKKLGVPHNLKPIQINVDD